MEQQYSSPYEEDNLSSAQEIPPFTDNIQNMPSDLINSHGFVRTIITTIAILLLSIPFIRTFVLQLLSLPRNAIRILALVFEETTDEIDIDIADDDDDDDDDGMEQDFDGTMLANAGFMQTCFIMIRRRFHALAELLSSLGISGQIIVGSNGKVDSARASASSSNIKGIASSVVAITKKKMTKKSLPNIAMPRIDQRDNLQEQNRIAKQQYDRISFDGNIEPAFLNDEEYPDDWMVYNPSQGKLVRKKDLDAEMHTALEIEKQTDQSTSMNRIHVETSGKTPGETVSQKQ